MLRAAELEVAVVFEYHGLDQPEFDRLYEGIELHGLLEDPMYLALPRRHPLARKRRVRLEDLAERPGSRSDTSDACGRLHAAACHVGRLRARSLGSSRTTTTSSRA